MFERTDTLADLLLPFGVTAEEAKIYLVLLENGVLSALSISRKLKMGRTKVYRLLDKLIGKELVVQKVNDAGLTFEACDPSTLRKLVIQKESEARTLKEAIPDILTVLERRMGRGKPGSKVLYYQGSKGLSQVNWNLLRAKGEFVSYEVATADAYLPEEEAEELRQELVEHEIFCRNIYNIPHIKPFTQVSDLVTRWWEARYIDPGELKIQADVFIYNDVYAMCHYLGVGEVFCVEIYNRYLAKMQKQLYEHVWQRAKKYKVLNVQGEAMVDD